MSGKNKAELSSSSARTRLIPGGCKAELSSSSARTDKRVCETSRLIPEGCKIELLAPAGTLEVFEVAVESGADAIYIGAPYFNARELAKHFTVAEVAAMIDFGHRNNVKVYLAMNSLVKEDEIPRVIEALAVLEKLAPDALIIQDLSLYYLVNKFFPGLRIHASTLMAAHNSMAVKKLAEMGFSRVVLPREITLAEIGEIANATEVELEVFVHGAMCFSYSGLCLFSSFQGGRSSLRGRCVQPCRRRYTWTGPGKGLSSGYFFSMNDLEGIDLLPDLARAGITSLKIEGRMRSSSYVGNVVRAYRTVLDAPPGDRQALDVAHGLLELAMGRKSTQGYFPGASSADVLSPQHSGNIGIFLGKVKSGRGKMATILTNAPLNVGDRLRLHQEKSGERQSFSLKKIKVEGRFAELAGTGRLVSIELPVQAATGDTIYKVDSVGNRNKAHRRKIIAENFVDRVDKLGIDKKLIEVMAAVGQNNSSQSVAAQTDKRFHETSRPMPLRYKKGSGPDLFPLPIWVRSDDPHILLHRFPVQPERFVINLSGEAFNRFLRMKRSGPLFRRIVWALPFVIDEERLGFFRERIGKLLELGYHEWQIGHLGQTGLFEGAKCRLYGDYTLNILNNLTAIVLQEYGLQGGLVSIENDRENLAGICRSNGVFKSGMTVYGFPALFTSRYSGPPMQYDRVFKSPKGESFLLRQAWGYTRALPLSPFSLLADLAEIAKLGIKYGVIDLSGQPLSRKVLGEAFQQTAGSGKGAKLTGFNFYRTLS